MSQQLLPYIMPLASSANSRGHASFQTLILNFSQGSVATHLRREIFNDSIVANFLESVSEKKIKIGQYLLNIWKEYGVWLLSHGVCTHDCILIRA